jgi:holin-like protein
MAPSFLVIVLFDLAGEAASRWLRVPLPGPVVGMLLLLMALSLRARWAAQLGRGGELLLRHMALFFVPAAVGVVTQLRVLQAEGLAVSVAVVASTIVGLVAGAGAFALVARARP